jgi:hypothetical protein
MKDAKPFTYDQLVGLVPVLNRISVTPNGWLQLLRQAVEAEGSSITTVAAKLGVSRTSISLVLAGKYPAKTDKIEARVLDIYARLICPHTLVEIRHAECRETAAAATPTSSPQAMRQWRACQSCIHKPSEGAKP